MKKSYKGMRAGPRVTEPDMFPEPYPVRTTVGSRLGGILVEIDVVAALP